MRGRGPFLVFLPWSLGCGAAQARTGVSSEGACLLVFLQGSHHTHFPLPTGQEQGFVIQKNASSGKPTCVAWKTTLSPGARGAVGCLAARLPGWRVSAHPGCVRSPAGGPSAFCQSRWSRHTWVQDICFSPGEEGCAKHCLVSFSVGGLVWLLNFQGGLEREWPTTTVSSSEVRRGFLCLGNSRQAGLEQCSAL